MSRSLAIVCTILLLSGIIYPQSQNNVLINELLVLNESNIPDEHGELNGWIEIYNPGPDSIDLGGMYLSNDFKNPALWQIPKTNPELTTIPPETFQFQGLGRFEVKEQTTRMPCQEGLISSLVEARSSCRTKPKKEHVSTSLHPCLLFYLGIQELQSLNFHRIRSVFF